MILDIAKYTKITQNNKSHKSQILQTKRLNTCIYKQIPNNKTHF